MLIGAGIVLVVILLGATVAARRAKRVGGSVRSEREDRRNTVLAANPMLEKMDQPVGLPLDNRRRYEAHLIADVAADAQDHPAPGHSEDVDLLNPHHGDVDGH